MSVVLPQFLRRHKGIECTHSVVAMKSSRYILACALNSSSSMYSYAPFRRSCRARPRSIFKVEITGVPEWFVRHVIHNSCIANQTYFDTRSWTRPRTLSSRWLRCLLVVVSLYSRTLRSLRCYRTLHDTLEARLELVSCHLLKVWVTLSFRLLSISPLEGELVSYDSIGRKNSNLPFCFDNNV